MHPLAPPVNSVWRSQIEGLLAQVDEVKRGIVHYTLTGNGSHGVAPVSEFRHRYVQVGSRRAR